MAKKRKEPPTDVNPPKKKPKEKEKEKEKDRRTSSKSTAPSSSARPPTAASSARETRKAQNTDTDDSDEEEAAAGAMPVTKKVRIKINKVAQSMCAHFAAAIGKELVEYKLKEGTDKDETVVEVEEEDSLLQQENELRRQLNLPLLRVAEEGVSRQRPIFVVPKLEGATPAENYIAQMLAEISVDCKLLKNECSTLKRTLNCICAAQVQQHQDLRFIRQAVGGEMIDSALKDVLKRCGQVLELRTNPLLKGVPFTSTTAIAEFFLCPDSVSSLTAYVLTYAEYNCHFTGHIVSLCIDPSYREKVSWCDTSIE